MDCDRRQRTLVKTSLHNWAQDLSRRPGAAIRGNRGKVCCFVQTGCAYHILIPPPTAIHTYFVRGALMPQFVNLSRMHPRLDNYANQTTKRTECSGMSTDPNTSSDLSGSEDRTRGGTHPTTRWKTEYWFSLAAGAVLIFASVASYLYKDPSSLQVTMLVVGTVMLIIPCISTFTLNKEGVELKTRDLINTASEAQGQAITQQGEVIRNIIKRVKALEEALAASSGTKLTLGVSSEQFETANNAIISRSEENLSRSRTLLKNWTYRA